ncbi:MAG: hypothetical protein LBI03_09440 [Clostridiales bacterium]|nr:hypothetical protein [Clostridiales bacterium]
MGDREGNACTFLLFLHWATARVAPTSLGDRKGTPIHDWATARVTPLQI